MAKSSHPITTTLPIWLPVFPIRLPVLCPSNYQYLLEWLQNLYHKSTGLDGQQNILPELLRFLLKTWQNNSYNRPSQSSLGKGYVNFSVGVEPLFKSVWQSDIWQAGEHQHGSKEAGCAFPKNEWNRLKVHNLSKCFDDVNWYLCLNRLRHNPAFTSPIPSFNSKLPAFVNRHCPTWVTTVLSRRSYPSR